MTFQTKAESCNFSDQEGDGATFQTEAETARLRQSSSRLRWIRRDIPYQGADGITFRTEAETTRLSIPGCRQHHFPEHGRDGPTKKMFLATAVDTARLWRSEWIWPTPRWIRRNFPDQGGDDATKNQILATKAETPRLSRPRRKWRDSSEQGGEGATFQTKTESAHFFKPKGRCRDKYGVTDRDKYRDKYGATKKVSLRPRWIHSIPGCRRHHFPERGGDGATKETFLATTVDTARPFIPGWRRPDFPDQDRVGTFFQTKREVPRFSRPRQIRRD